MTMAKHMTLAQIEDRFESEWVLVSDPEVDEHLQVTGGRVLWHSKDRDEVDRKLLELRPKVFATLYTGRIPKDAAVIL
jgi:hypothetical protein